MAITLRRSSMRHLVAFLLVGCVSTNSAPEAISLLGAPLYPSIPSEVRLERAKQLEAARRTFEQDPRSAEAIIWLGRRTAYLGRYREAIKIYSRGLRLFPDDPRFYRHRGHRYITTRQLDRAVADLQKAGELIAGQADQIEPDGLPNALNIPTSTLQFNIWYHLGLAHYLRGDLERAASAYEECLKVSNNPDSLVATTHWYFMTLRRMGRVAEAMALLERIDSGTKVIENESYLQLVLMYKGLRSAEQLLSESSNSIDAATVGYGIGNWYLSNGRPQEAWRIFEQVIAGKEWPAFGYIAAEADIARERQIAGITDDVR